VRLTRFFQLKESVRQLQAREGINGLAFRLKEEPFRVDPAELIFGETGLFYLAVSGALTRVTLYDAEQRVDSDQMDPLMRTNVVGGGFDNLSLIEQLPRFHFLNCEQLQNEQQSEWRESRAWQISHRENSRFIFSYTTKSGVLCDMDSQRLLPCPHCVTAMNELGYMPGIVKNADNTDSGHFLSLLDSSEFYTRQKAIRPSSCPSVPKCFWTDWPELTRRYLAISTPCANTGRDAPECDSAGASTHYSHCDINHKKFHYLTNLCQPCHQQKPGHEHLRLSVKAELE